MKEQEGMTEAALLTQGGPDAQVLRHKAIKSNY